MVSFCFLRLKEVREELRIAAAAAREELANAYTSAQRVLAAALSHSEQAQLRCGLF